MSDRTTLAILSPRYPPAQPPRYRPLGPGLSSGLRSAPQAPSIPSPPPIGFATQALTFDDGQGRAIAEIHRDAGAELATKGDLANLHAETKADLAELRADLYRALWIQAAALIGTQLATAGFVVHLLSQP